MSVCKEEMIIACARAAHEVNRVYCGVLGETFQPSWDDAPQYVRDGCIVGVFGVLERYYSPEQSHEAWLDMMESQGWKRGPAKDTALREHPNMVPYAEMSPEQKKKDFLFVNTVKNVAVVLGWRDAQVAQLQGRGE